MGVCGGHERMGFFTICYVGSLWWYWKNWFLTVSNLVVCGGLERADFLPFGTLGVCGDPKRIGFLQFLI